MTEVELLKEELVDTILDPSQAVKELIPDTTGSEQLLGYLGKFCMAAGFFRDAIVKIKPAIGRCLVLIEDDKETYRSMGYRRFEDFLVEYVDEKLGISRSESFECMRIARNWPDLDQQTYAEIGISNMKELNRICKQSDPSSEKILQAAKDMTASDFKIWCKEKHYLVDGEDSGFARIGFSTTKDIEALWRRFIANPKVIGFVGSESPGEILTAMIAEVELEWMAQFDARQSGTLEAEFADVSNYTNAPEEVGVN